MEQYKDMVEYIDAAKKTIRTFADKICPGICYQMTQSEDAIADVAYAMMCADWKYDDKRTGKISKKSKTRYSYRNQCALWAIQTYIKQSLKNKTIYLNSLIDNNDLNINDIIEDSRQSLPETTIIEKEEQENLHQTTKDILESDILTDSQKEKMRMYYVEGLSLAKIGKRYGVSREAIRQTLKGCIKKLQGEFV